MRYTTRPLSDKAWLRPARERVTSQFRVTWSDALEVLDREIGHLAGRDVVIEIDIREQDLRLDGTLRANAKAVGAPAVIVAFESKHGPLLYRSDQYAGQPSYRRGGMNEPWQHNVYAVALTLEALRAVDRYGAARSGEQYRGYRQIGGGPAIVTDAPWTDERARDVLLSAAYPSGSLSVLREEHDILADRAVLDVVVRFAKRNTHPDTRHPGARVSFDDVQRAAAHLRGTR